MITARQITRAIHSFAVSLHVAALRSDKRVTERRAARTVKQTRLVQAASAVRSWWTRTKSSACCATERWS